jgi:Mn2+/Fe2+ NRAMP family transporter
MAMEFVEPKISGELYPEVPESLGRLTPRSLFRYVGPGFIIASVTIGSGELVWASRGGAIFGYSILWCFLVAGIFKAIQVYSAGRYLILTGEHPMTSWSHMPGPRYWFPLLIALPTVVVMPIAFSAISEILGGYLHVLTGESEGGPLWGFEHRELWENIWATAVLSGCFVLALVSTLTVLERISAVVLAIVVGCVLVAVLVSQPDMLGILEGMVVPRVNEYESWVTSSSSEFVGRSPWLEVALYLSAVGGGTYDYVGYIGLMRDKKWGLSGAGVTSRETIAEAIGQPGEAGRVQRERARKWMRAPLIDTTISFSAVIIVTLMFAVLGSELLHERELVIKNEDLLSRQETFLTMLHPSLKWIYRTGVFLAFIGTLYGAFAIYQRTMIESVRALRDTELSTRASRYIRWAMMAYCYLGGMLLMWLPKSVAGGIVGRMTFGAVIGGATFCGLWCLAMLWTDRNRLPPPLRMPWPLWIATLLGGIVMTGLGVWTLIVYFLPDLS